MKLVFGKLHAVSWVLMADALICGGSDAELGGESGNKVCLIMNPRVVEPYMAAR